jgi:hypothetical protein
MLAKQEHNQQRIMANSAANPEEMDVWVETEWGMV